jgi:orotate phosphoribosyltransferase
MTDRQQLIELLAARSIKRGNFVLASGKTSEIYIDVRLTSMSPEGLSLIGPLVLRAIRDAGWIADSIGGMTLGADPIAYATSYASSIDPPLLRAFTVRKETKEHGTGRLVEGPFQSGDHVVVVEDVITTGGSALRAIQAITESGGSISGVVSVVDREEGGRDALEAKGFEVISLVSISELTQPISS